MDRLRKKKREYRRVWVCVCVRRFVYHPVCVYVRAVCEFVCEFVCLCVCVFLSVC